MREIFLNDQNTVTKKLSGVFDCLAVSDKVSLRRRVGQILLTSPTVEQNRSGDQLAGLKPNEPITKERLPPGLH